MSIAIRSATPKDAAQLVAIYNHYIANTHITFETEPLSEDRMAQRIAKTLSAPLPWLVAESSGEILGYAYAAPWRERYAYRFSVESTIYMSAKHTGKGVGLQLYTALVEAVRGLSVRIMIGGIALPNDPSIRLHEQLGFKKVGRFEEVGFKNDGWVDVGYWQLLL